MRLTIKDTVTDPNTVFTVLFNHCNKTASVLWTITEVPTSSLQRGSTVHVLYLYNVHVQCIQTIIHIHVHVLVHVYVHVAHCVCVGLYVHILYTWYYMYVTCICPVDIVTGSDLSDGSEDDPDDMDNYNSAGEEIEDYDFDESQNEIEQGHIEDTLEGNYRNYYQYYYNEWVWFIDASDDSHVSTEIIDDDDDIEEVRVM